MKKKKKKALEKDLALEALEKKQNRQNSVSLLFSIDRQDISSLVEKEREREREKERDISFLVSTYVVGITFVRLFQQLSPVFGDLLQVIWNEDRFQETPGL